MYDKAENWLNGNWHGFRFVAHGKHWVVVEEDWSDEGTWFAVVMEDGEPVEVDAFSAELLIKFLAEELLSHLRG